MCLIGENISKILSEEPDLRIIYAGLFSYKIPVYKYLSDALGVSESDVKENIELCTGSNAAQMIVDGMNADYGGSFNGFTSNQMEIISRAAMTGFKDVYLSEISAFGFDGKKLETYYNLMPEK